MTCPMYAPYGARCFHDARHCRTPCDRKRHVGSPVVEEASSDQQTQVRISDFRCDYLYRHGPPASRFAQEIYRPSGVSPDRTSHTCRVTTSLLVEGQVMTIPATARLRKAISLGPYSRRDRLLTAHTGPTGPKNAATPGGLTDGSSALRSDWVPHLHSAGHHLQQRTPSARALWPNRRAKPRTAAHHRRYGTYDDTRAGHGSFSRGVIDN